jgi:hypothetical protein
MAEVYQWEMERRGYTMAWGKIGRGVWSSHLYKGDFDMHESIAFWIRGI